MCSYQCYNNETCDPVFGNCSRCADGYQKAKCDESKILNLPSCSYTDKNEIMRKYYNQNTSNLHFSKMNAILTNHRMQ